MAWVETPSQHFTARHESQDGDDVTGLLELLESTRERLAAAFPSLPEHTGVAVHGSRPALLAAQPLVAVVRSLTAPAGRRYVAGWPARTDIHVLAPRLLAARASSVPGSREMELLAPATLYTLLVIGHVNPALRRAALGPRGRWAWLAHGAAQWFSGQAQHARPAIARRLREGGRPSFPPSLRDAPLLGATIIDLVAREEGEHAAIALTLRKPRGNPRKVLAEVFQERPTAHTEGTWRGHLRRLAEPG